MSLIITHNLVQHESTIRRIKTRYLIALLCYVTGNLYSYNHYLSFLSDMKVARNQNHKSAEILLKTILGGFIQ
jgi:hypothetical protein